MIHILAILLSGASFTFLCFSMQRHKRTMVAFGLAPPPWLPLRFIGFAGLGAVLIMDLIFLGAVLGVIAWFGHLTAGAACMAAALCASAQKS